MQRSLLAKIPWWVVVLIIAAAWRLVVLASNSVSFHSDEAVVGLMARHIFQGKPIPTFFYGQPYMGSLDPLLVAGMFALVGESVLSIRLVQAILYLGTVFTTMLLVLRLSGSSRVAVTAGLLIAVPPVVFTLYTTVSMGGYGEIVLFGNLIMLLGYDIYREQAPSWARWMALGTLTGLGWWTNGLIVVYAFPLAVMLLVRLLREGMLFRYLPVIFGAGAAFLVFSAPWWLYNFSHNWEALQFLLTGFEPEGGVPRLGPPQHLAALLVIGLPGVLGTRFPWMPKLWSDSPLLVVFLLVYLTLLVMSLIQAVRRPGATRYVWGMVLGYCLIFVLSTFGVDPSGRYLLPLVVPFAILVANQMDSWRVTWLIVAGTTFFVGANALATVHAMRSVPPGITTQFDPVTDFTNDFDQEVISFLTQLGAKEGYTTYWGAYRLVFLSEESIILAPGLPVDTSLAFPGPGRYPPYDEIVSDAQRPVLVSANLPVLDEAIVRGLERAGITGWEQRGIGPYTIYYNLPRHITPAELGFGPPGPP